MKRQNGAGVIELIIVIFILGIFIFALVGTLNASLQVARAGSAELQARFLLEEGIEAARNIRDWNWNTVALAATSTNYYLLFSSGRWSATTTAQPRIDGIFDRAIVFSDVFRDSTSRDIVLYGGVWDQNIKKVIARVSWQGKSVEQSVSVYTYIANLFDN